jgi:hypothetical protein
MILPIVKVYVPGPIDAVLRLLMMTLLPFSWHEVVAGDVKLLLRRHEEFMLRDN